MIKKTRTGAGEMIRQARIGKDWTQQQLGKMLGYNYGNFIGMIENGNSMIPFDKIPILCDLLDLDPRKLLKEVIICRHPELAKYF